MDCPVCKNAMITLELAEVEIDYCAGCKGIWLDAGELELLLGDGGKTKELISSFDKAARISEKPRKCPICDKGMEKIIVGRDKPTILIDRCAKGDGLWFDKGELNEITGRAKLDEGNKIKQLLADMFGQRT
jgi:Zn-finger nucleic acid-binding protein